MHLGDLRLLAVLVFGLFGGAADGQEGKDMKLEDVGFVMRPANTPQQIERLQAVAAAHICRAQQGRAALLPLRRSGLLQMRVPGQ